MEVQIWSIPRSDEEKAKWPGQSESCSRCGQEFGHRKIGKDKDGNFYHYNGCPVTDS